MGWSIGFDTNWNRDIGYGVPAICDQPKCDEQIDRGLSYVCGGEQPFGGDSGCGLYFCSKHLYSHTFRNGDDGEFCKRCIRHRLPYNAKPDTKEWIKWKLTDKSWKQWRHENIKVVEEMKANL